MSTRKSRKFASALERTGWDPKGIGLITALIRSFFLMAYLNRATTAK